ncbi:stage IV sporulation protein A [Ruminiclostridium cellulolyticum]|uniref:stage IV sporulation protein A n=1 Tax=Ruminiclostridium cellulolyticum TaxID=1521 RepID=UPI0000E935DF|nr:stage IV sporulation protein A [Ruminiclostridium cellulolyticum]
MDKFNIYQQIAERTQGDIYIGIVGPVRTGKSTFIKRFMDLLVIPNIENTYQKERAIDELPQSASGRTIMTTEPKFIPNEAVEVVIDENVQLKVRMIDCVGYMVKGAMGHLENNAPRMVSTPWYDHQIPFEEAAELGTRKVINEHSTIGIVITTDGSISDIPREDYIEAERRVITELKAINKPFVVIINSTNPRDSETLKLRDEMEQKYGVTVIAMDCLQMRIDDVDTVMEKVLHEFPICEIGINIPRWVEALDDSHWLKADIINSIRDSFKSATKIRAIKDALPSFEQYDFIKRAAVDKVSLGEGTVLIDLTAADGLLYQILSEESGMEIEGEHKLISLIKDLARVKKEYDRVEYALHEVKVKGYGMVSPQMEELTLEEPEIIKQGNKFGVKLRASAPSIHIVRYKQKCCCNKRRYRNNKTA